MSKEVFESGEKEQKQALEEVTTRNVKTMIAYSKDTREIVRELEKKVNQLEEYNRNQLVVIEALKLQLAGIQTKLFSGGTE
jgi:hypothetical protein